jgi:hypothetical protein
MIHFQLLCLLIVFCLTQFNTQAQLYIQVEDSLIETLEYYQVDYYNLGERTNCKLSKDTLISLSNTSFISVVTKDNISYSVLKSKGDTLILTSRKTVLNAEDSLMSMWYDNVNIELRKAAQNKDSLLSVFERSKKKLKDNNLKHKYVAHLNISILQILLSEYMRQKIDSEFVRMDEDLRTRILKTLSDTITYEYNNSYNLVNWFVVLEKTALNQTNLWVTCDQLELPFEARKLIMGYLYNIYLIRHSDQTAFPEDLILKYFLDKTRINTSPKIFDLGN